MKAERGGDGNPSSLFELRRTRWRDWEMGGRLCRRRGEEEEEKTWGRGDWQTRRCETVSLTVILIRQAGSLFHDGDEFEINGRIMRLFDLIPEEIRLQQKEVEH